MLCFLSLFLGSPVKLPSLSQLIQMTVNLQTLGVFYPSQVASRISTLVGVWGNLICHLSKLWGVGDLTTPSQLLRLPAVTLPAQSTLISVFCKSKSLVANF